MDSPIELQLRELLADITPLPANFTRDTDLLDALALESAQIMEFIMEVEDCFDIVIDQRHLADVRNVAQLAAVVGKAVA